MKKLIILLVVLLGLLGYCSAQSSILINGQRFSNGTNIAKFNFSRPANPVAGYNNVVATSSSSIGSLSVTDPTTGWTLITNSSHWEAYFGSVAHLTNGDGGATAASPFSASALSCGFLQAGHSFAVSGGTIGSNGGAPFEFTNLPAGTYEIKVISTIKSTINPNLPNGIWYFKFGSSSSTNQTTTQQADNLTVLTFTGTITTGERIRFGPFNPNEDANATATVVNCLQITKTS